MAEKAEENKIKDDKMRFMRSFCFRTFDLCRKLEFLAEEKPLGVDKTGSFGQELL